MKYLRTEKSTVRPTASFVAALVLWQVARNQITCTISEKPVWQADNVIPFQISIFNYQSKYYTVKFQHYFMIIVLIAD